MPRGATVIRYQGKRGVSWRIKYRDAAGKQVQETLGPEPPWTERRAQRELGKRLAAVDEGFRKPKRITFAEFTGRFLREYVPSRNLKLTTAETTATSFAGTSSPSSATSLSPRSRPVRS